MSPFFKGIIVGVGGLWVIHHFAAPIPGGKSS